MKKILKLVLVVVLLITMLVVLTACGNEEKQSQESNNKAETGNVQENVQGNVDDDSEDYLSTVQKTLKEKIESIETTFNNGEIANIENYIDYNAATAYYLWESYGKDVDFHEIYNLINYIDEYGTNQAFADYKDFVAELNGESAEDLNDLILVRNNMQSYFEDFIDHYSNAEDVKVEITSVTGIEQLESNIYSIDIEYTYSGIFEGVEDSGEEYDTVYFIEFGNEYYVIYSDDFNIS